MPFHGGLVITKAYSNEDFLYDITHINTICYTLFHFKSNVHEVWRVILVSVN